MSKMMKCAIYYGVQDVRIEERPVPQVGDGDVLIKVLRAGICGSDVGIYMHGGENYGLFPGSQFGHEMVGKVVEKGSSVDSDISVGDLMFVDPVMSQRGGVGGSIMAGAFSEYALVQDAKIGVNLYKLDKNVNLDKAVIIEPMSVGVQGAVAFNPKSTDKAVVLGAGPIGLSAAAGLIGRGLKNVAVVDINDFRLQKAEQLGAKTVNTKKEGLKDKLISCFGAVPGYFPVPDVDLYVDAAGAPALFAEAFGYARPGTKYGIVAVFNQITIPGQPFIAAQPIIYGSQGYTHDTIVEVIEHITQNKTDIASIVTDKFAHADINEAIKRAASGNGIKVIIDYEN